MLVIFSAYVFAMFSFVIILFQLGLTIGMPWGAASMGGKYPGKYPPRMRVVSLINIFITSFIATIVLIKSEIIWLQFKSFANVAIYFVVAFSAVATILNTITPSKIERIIWAPVAAILLLTSLIVAFVKV
ncbi:MAG TPA: hypothetical protein DHV28_05655 [Ignavibacteriales bacterium]|nr:hypothetical protein [Ignavibacteriales bacterium]